MSQYNWVILLWKLYMVYVKCVIVDHFAAGLKLWARTSARPRRWTVASPRPPPPTPSDETWRRLRNSWRRSGKPRDLSCTRRRTGPRLPTRRSSRSCPCSVARLPSRATPSTSTGSSTTAVSPFFCLSFSRLVTMKSFPDWKPCLFHFWRRWFWFLATTFFNNKFPALTFIS